MKSTHIPEMAGDVVEVTGELIVDTELRSLQSATATMAQEPTAAEATCGWEAEPRVAGDTAKIKLFVKAADGVTAGIAAAKVSWTALGK